jgi:hypothetical protein
MKRGTPRHPKTKALARALKISDSHAAGILAFLWDFASDFCPDGGIGRLSDEEIAEACGWPEKKAKALIEALAEKRWIEAHPECRYYIHDWHEHCEDTVQRKLARALRLFANGTVPKLSSLNKAERPLIEQQYAERAHGVPTACPPKAHGEGTPCPLPEPEPVPRPEPVPEPQENLLAIFESPDADLPVPSDGVEPEELASVSAETVSPKDGKAFLASIGWKGGWRFLKDKTCESEQIHAIQSLKADTIPPDESIDSLYMIHARLWWFEEFWMDYWRKAAKKEARIAFFEKVRTLDLFDRIVAAVTAQGPQMMAKGEEYRPHAATWLRRESWNDEVSGSNEPEEGTLWEASSEKPHSVTRVSASV